MSLFPIPFANLTVDKVSRVYDKRLVLNEVSLEVLPGEVVGLLGPNGAGKTTMMKILSGLTKPISGRVMLNGWEVGERRQEAHLRVGLIPQENNLERDLTVRQALRCYGWLFGVQNIEEKIVVLAEKLEFKEMLDKLSSKLSGGYARRVLIARALLPDPDILLLDEPSVGLDPDVRHQLWGIIRTLREQKKAVLLTTHYMEEAEALCDRVYFLQKGKVAWHGDPVSLNQEDKGLEDLFLEIVRESEGGSE